MQERRCKVDRKRETRYSQKLRCRTVERMNACENILRLSRELCIHRRLLYKCGIKWTQRMLVVR